MNSKKSLNQIFLIPNSFYSFLFLLLSCGLVVSSCKKEYIDKFNDIPADTVTVLGDNHIRSFAIKEYSTDTVLKATIAKDSILVYWPAYKPLPAKIKPEIMLPDSAEILPVSGAEVEFKTGTVYTVTSGAGTKKTYYLKIIGQQFKPEVLEANYNSQNGSILDISLAKDGLLTDTARTKVTLILNSDASKTYPAKVRRVTNTGVQFIIPPSLPAGIYDISILNGFNTLTGSTVTVSFPVSPIIFTYDLPSPLALKLNETFTLQGLVLENVTAALLRRGADNQYYPIEIISKTSSTITLKIPAGFAVGDYYQLRLTTPSGNRGSGIDFVISN